jgi:putative ABC transport system substrate-binding protein
MRGRALVAGLLCLFAGGGLARAAPTGILVVADSRIPQYREALASAKETLHNPNVVDPGAADAAEQVRRADPAVILAIGQKAVQLAKTSAPATPTVFCMVLGQAAAASRSVTGVRLEVLPSAQLQQLRLVHPGARRLGVIYDPRTSASFLEDATKAAGAQGFTLVSRPVNDPREVRPALNEIAGAIDALWLMPDSRLLTAEMFSFLLSFTLERKIALYGFLDSFTEAGALASISPDYQEIGRRAAKLAAELADKPPEVRLPVPPPISSPGALTVNLKTAKQLHLDVPSGVLSKARQVYR